MTCLERNYFGNPLFALFMSCLLSFTDETHRAKEIAYADAQFYKSSKEAEANKVNFNTPHLAYLGVVNVTIPNFELKLIDAERGFGVEKKQKEVWLKNSI